MLDYSRFVCTVTIKISIDACLFVPRQRNEQQFSVQMKKYKSILYLLIILVLITGCATNKKETNKSAKHNNDQQEEKVEVESNPASIYVQ